MVMSATISKLKIKIHIKNQLYLSYLLNNYFTGVTLASIEPV